MTQLAPERQGVIRHGDVELQVAYDGDAGRAERSQPLGVRDALRCGARERSEERSRQRCELRIARGGTRGQPRVHEKQRDAARMAVCGKVRPQLGLHQRARKWMEMREKRAHGERQVVRQPGLHDAIAIKRTAAIASRRGHVGQHQRRVGPLAQHVLDQWRRGARFSERHRMDPENVARGRGDVGAVSAEPFADARTVAGLLAAAPPQSQRQERQRKPPQQRIDGARHVRWSTAGDVA